MQAVCTIGLTVLEYICAVPAGDPWTSDQFHCLRDWSSSISLIHSKLILFVEQIHSDDSEGITLEKRLNVMYGVQNVPTDAPSLLSALMCLK